MVGSIIVVLAMGVVYESLKTLREFLMTVDGRRGKKSSSVKSSTVQVIKKFTQLPRYLCVST